MTSAIISALLISTVYFALIDKYRKLWNNLPNHDSLKKQFSVAILIPFRNEEAALPKLLSSLHNLNTSNLEMEYVFVDDHSTDNSVPLITEFLSDRKGQLLTLKQETGKKAAVSLAWSKIKTALIVQTDADCEVQPEWLQSLLAPFENDDTKLVSGPVKFNKENNFWKQLVALDFAGLIAIGAAHVQWERPLICNGANLAYRTNAIQTANLKTAKASGEDVFLMESIAKESGAASIAFCKNKLALVRTNGPQNFTTFWNQRLRWASKNGDYANTFNLALLGFIWSYNLAIVLLCLAFHPAAYTMAAFLVLAKVQSEIRFYSQFEGFFGISDSWKNILLGQPFHIIYMAFMPIFSLVLKYQWKERKQK